MAASYRQTFTHTAAQETFDRNRTAKYHQTSYKLFCFSHKMHLSLLLYLYNNPMSFFAINALFCYKIRFLRSAIKFTYINQSWVASSMITMILFLACTITRARISIFATVLIRIHCNCFVAHFIHEYKAGCFSRVSHSRVFK